MLVQGSPAPVRGLPPRVRRQSGRHAGAGRRRARRRRVYCASLGRGRGGRGRRRSLGLVRRRTSTGSAPVTPSCSRSTARSTQVTADGIHPLAPGRTCPAAWNSAPPRIPTPCCSWATARWWKCASAPACSTTGTAADLTIRLGRGSVIVQAATAAGPPVCGYRRLPRGRHRHRVQRHAGVKGSRVSVVQGEVHVTQDNQEKILHRRRSDRHQPAAWSRSPVRDDISWSRNRDSSAEADCAPAWTQVHLPGLRYSSNLLGRSARVHRVLRQHSQPGAVPGARPSPCCDQQDRRKPAVELRSGTLADRRCGRSMMLARRQRIPGRRDRISWHAPADGKRRRRCSWPS